MDAPAFLFLAQIGGEVPLDHHEMSLIALSVVAVFVVAIALLIAWATVRRNPPIEREIDERIAQSIGKLERDWGERLGDLRIEMHGLNKERRDNVEKLFEAVEAVRKEAKMDNVSIQKTMQAGFMEVQRVLGRLEAKS